MCRCSDHCHHSDHSRHDYRVLAVGVGSSPCRHQYGPGYLEHFDNRLNIDDRASRYKNPLLFRIGVSGPGYWWSSRSSRDPECIYTRLRTLEGAHLSDIGIRGHGPGRETLMECETWRGGIIIWKWADTHLRQELSGSDLWSLMRSHCCNQLMSRIAQLIMKALSTVCGFRSLMVMTTLNGGIDYSARSHTHCCWYWMLNPKTFWNAAAYWWSQIGCCSLGQSQECPEFWPLKLFPPGSVVRSAWAQHRLNMVMKCLHNSKTQYLAIQFADFLQAGSRILTSLLFSLTWSPVSLYTQGYFLTIVLQTGLQYRVHSLQHCSSSHQLIECRDQDINMLPTQSYSIPRLTKSPWPIPEMPAAKLQTRL